MIQTEMDLPEILRRKIRETQAILIRIWSKLALMRDRLPGDLRQEIDECFKMIEKAREL